MVCTSFSQMMNLCRYEPTAARSSETVAEKSQKFAEESTFFLSLFKNRTVKPMPDVGLMLVLQKDKTRKKKRKVNKKEKPENLYFTRKQREEDPMDEGESDALA